jgi:enolase-phosphatase E1
LANFAGKLFAMKAILLDIEGTTTPIDFVHKTLFPFAKERIGKYVEQHFGELSKQIAELVDESSHDDTYTVPVDPTEPGSVATYLEHLIDVDRKSKPLKAIQGMIWKEGYESGELRSIVYDDVPSAFERWANEGKTIAIYSSGSVLAQKLLFAYTNHGDLTPTIAHYFDTEVGHKRDADSYRRIAESLSVEAGRTTFFSDIPEELAAANEAGVAPIMVIRPGNAEHPAAGQYRAVKSFDEIA